MPELPEVETTLRGIKPHIEHHKIVCVTIRHHGLRWPVPLDINKYLQDQVVTTITRRGKYLLFQMAKGTLILHLGMSGSLRMLTCFSAPQKHDHVDILFDNQMILRFTDPRRFGALLWTENDSQQHELIKHLGPEPLSRAFTSDYLYSRAKGRKVPIKTFIMDNKTVVGVGNIYATEALFAAGIHPKMLAGNLKLAGCQRLVTEIKIILRAAIKQGGTTLKDFVGSTGKPGYFKFHLKAYGRGGLPCIRCKTLLQEMRLGQRSTVYCGRCQKIS